MVSPVSRHRRLTSARSWKVTMAQRHRHVHNLSNRSTTRKGQRCHRDVEQQAGPSPRAVDDGPGLLHHIRRSRKVLRTRPTLGSQRDQERLGAVSPDLSHFGVNEVQWMVKLPESIVWCLRANFQQVCRP